MAEPPAHNGVIVAHCRGLDGQLMTIEESDKAKFEQAIKKVYVARATLLIAHEQRARCGLCVKDNV